MKETTQAEKMNDLLRLVAPGTAFRDGLENVLRAKTGGLIVVGYSPEVMEVVEGASPSTVISPQTISMSWPKWTGRSSLARI